ncbi:general secretion pathway protein GspK [Methylobacterium gossipiicola]|uniref:General secretion pathway protein K n=1 Tax=Methylobacterium gossipiicola TaxID=582675 RepID=A0A1I2X1S0_9HYPH|nr:type II secretion system protein GspK [Methylobacterium gossipiicola]SFH07514.1 general secretion pathway protein K [Methylobacterium gossipiicola]
MSSGEKPVGEAGFVLPAVLAILVVLSAAAVTAALRLQTRTALATVRGDGVRLQGLADGIARLLAHGFVVERTYRMPRLDLPEDGSPIACPLPGGLTARIAVRDQGRLLDLNTTPRLALEEALRVLAVPDGDARTLAAEIVDFRDPDDITEPGGGAEVPQYRARGLADGPRNGPFVSADEIEQLPSMTPALAARLRPYVTVFNPGGQFDTTPLPGGASEPRPSPRLFLRIEVSVADAKGIRAGRSALVSTGPAPIGTGVVAWTQSVPPSEAKAPVARGACTRIVAVLEP